MMDDYKRRRLDEDGDMDVTAMASTWTMLTSPPVDRFPSMADQFLQLEHNQCHELDSIQFTDPVSYVYNPVMYAGQPHSLYVRKYCQGPKHCLFVGMNPGPFGMAQTGVPFGQISVVRDWMCIDGVVRKPEREHPRRQILGFGCKRNEVSGQRFWGLFREMSGTPEVFFRHCFVHNYCPLMFTSKTGKNVTPPSIALAERRRLQVVCDAYVCRIARLLDVRVIVAVGRYTYDRTVDALRSANMLDDVRVAFIMHPSPINPIANRGWAGIVRKKLEELDIAQYLCPP